MQNDFLQSITHSQRCAKLLAALIAIQLTNSYNFFTNGLINKSFRSSENSCFGFVQILIAANDVQASRTGLGL